MNPPQINRKKWEELVGKEEIVKEKITHKGLKRDKYTGEYLNWF